MAARIQSLRNGITPIDELSRNDLVVGDIVTVSSLDAATTYNWAIAFAPEGSAATFSGSATAVSPGTFTVDLVGPYLIKLTVDVGLASEDTQYVRLRALTSFLSLQLVSAGERRDGTGIIPVDVDPEGWANEQNSNLQALESSLEDQTLIQEGITEGVVTLDMTPGVPLLQDGTYAYRILIVARGRNGTPAAGLSGYITIDGVIADIGGVVGAPLVSTPVVIWDGFGGAPIAATTNNNGNQLNVSITGTGAAGFFIHWSARITLVDVRGI